jgi:formate hydrogenlyase subunit 3/multisubunit Na+/H+ antiporter MnhD subunit
MSLPDSDPTDQPTKRIKEPIGWGLWRKLMMAGALVLLANAVIYAVMDPDPHRAFNVVGNAIGYVLLALGFGQRMRDRKG